MKKLKNILVLTLALVLVLATAVPAFAATIQINRTTNGQTYHAYKIFDVINNDNSYAYYIKTDSKWLDVLESYMNSVTSPGFLIKNGENDPVITIKNAAGTPEQFYEVTPNPDMPTVPLAKYLAKYLIDNATKDPDTGAITKYPIDNDGSAVSNADDSAVTINVADNGFYLVTSSLGSICIMVTAADSATIDEKNSRPTIEKTVSKPSASVGDKLEFVLTVKASRGADDVYTVTDTMTNGLTFNPAATDAFTIKLYKNATPSAGTSTAAEPEIVDKANYSIILPGENDTFDFKIVFSKEFTAILQSTDDIKITYTATLNDDAINRDKETNTVLFNYKNIEKSAEVDVTNYGFGLVKTGANGITYLGDDRKAQFKLFRDKEWTDEIKLVKDFYKDADGNDTTEWCYRPAMVVGKNDDGTDRYEVGVVDYIEAGYVRIDGLEGILSDGGSSQYYLEETLAPSGYNKVPTPIEVVLKDSDKFHTVNKKADNSVEIIPGDAIKVANRKGSVIPETGGIGTTIFYVLGSILLIGAGVLLVTRKRMNTTK